MTSDQVKKRIHGSKACFPLSAVPAGQPAIHPQRGTSLFLPAQEVLDALSVNLVTEDVWRSITTRRQDRGQAGGGTALRQYERELQDERLACPWTERQLIEKDHAIHTDQQYRHEGKTPGRIDVL